MMPASRLRNRWLGASVRERRMLTVAATVLVVAGLISVSEWVWRERQRLATAVPAAEARLARMQDQADALASLARAAPGARAPISDRVAAARAAAAARGLDITLEEQGDGVAVSGRGPAAGVIEWLAAMQADEGLRPLELELTPSPDALGINGRLLAVGGDGG
ncbi:MAG: type II secretion system protein M [Rhodocyclaceae bacterium]|nr:type II secretion system protein M [Rhodocyclaceae bacterium]